MAARVLVFLLAGCFGFPTTHGQRVEKLGGLSVYAPRITYPSPITEWRAGSSASCSWYAYVSRFLPTAADEASGLNRESHGLPDFVLNSTATLFLGELEKRSSFQFDFCGSESAKCA